VAAVTTYFLKDVAISGFGSLSETDPGATTMNTGWVVAKLAAANFSKLLYGTERASTAFSTTDALTTATAPAGGDSWRSENPITGTFANANWTLTFRVRAVTAASAQTGRVKVRIWRSTNAAGTGATQITSGMLTGTTTAALSTTVDATSTVTFTPGATVTLTNEYLFVQCEWETVAVSGSNSGDVDFRASASTVVTSTFTPGNQTLTPSLYSEPADTFYAPGVLAAYALTQGARHDDADSFYAPALSSIVALSANAILDNAQAFNTHDLTQAAGGPSYKLVVSYSPGANRQDFTGEVGIRIRPVDNVLFNQIGLRRGLDNTGIHVVNLYEWFSGDLLRTASINLTGGTEGAFYYADISPITLTGGGYYALLATVTASDGQWWANEGDTTVDAAIVTEVVYATYRVPASAFAVTSPGKQYVGVDLAFVGGGEPAAQTLAPALLTDADGFHAPALAASAAISPSLYDNPQGFYAPTRGASNALAPALHANAQGFPPPASSSTITLAPPLTVNLQNFLVGDPYFFLPVTLALGGGAIQTLAPVLYSDPDNLAFSHTAGAGGVILYTGMYNDLPDTFFGASMAGGIPAGVGLARTHPFLENVGQLQDRS
jgi:hypothetical protein